MNPNDKSNATDPAFTFTCTREQMAKADVLTPEAREVAKALAATIDEIDDLQATYQRMRDGAQ